MSRLCIEAEKASPGAICSILSIDPLGLLRPLAAPGLPPCLAAALDGLAIGPDSGCCGSAVYWRQEVVVTDIEHDACWAQHKHLVLPLGLRACWSSPILGASGMPVGVFAFYFKQPRGPSAAERRIVRQVLQICQITLDRHRRSEEQQRRTLVDELTGMPNRLAFEAALAELPVDDPGSWAILMVDVDNLKIVNDTFGNRTGDHLLKIVAERVSLAVTSEPIFRIGGDEFVVLLRSPALLYDLEQTAERILSAISQPTECGDDTVVPRATIGGAALSIDEPAAERVRQNAAFALYHAKETGRGGFVRYWPGLGTQMNRRLGHLKDVDLALREGRIDAFYQPIFLLGTREVVGLEALCRMRIGNEIVSAASFQEATKDAHISAALTARMVDIVAKDVRSWLDLGIPFQHVGINVSSADMHSGGLAQLISTAFDRYRVPLSHIILEVTETVYMNDDDDFVQKSIEVLRAEGLKVALDDFGTGYASLTHLLSVPVDIIKIDKSFVDRLAVNDASAIIIQGLIGIAKGLGIRVVAEGVETQGQAEHLAAIGCKLGQGYLLSRAVDRHATTRLLLDHAQARAA
ncbi:putative bifunctional diguanylate cyclase/phosphodiesterase [Sphingomonas qomolangmaensis]|uniref:GGDEF domain-containing protein n=1 Tax=Sphingomonas qomolangmaensis TaxID=2918765 RepID=A0ABY5L8G1_9SPHN|nr:GGDEF domain-containing protein [Sphingomonas qomolangmaensis]UUL83263.1 GGDEF domain-containing protein [Sphingomonas qomolangmaensis]